MHLLLWIIIFTLLGGILSVVAASVFLWLPEKQRARLLPHGVSFAIGALLSVAFVGLIPQAFEGADSQLLENLSLTILGGILTFFLLEKLLLWRHSHSGECAGHGANELLGPHPSGVLILVGDAIHNFVDGVLIGAAFMTDIQLGIITSLAVAAHEIPQEVGDFAILLNSGYERREAFFWNVLASVTTVLGGLLAYFALGRVESLLPYILAIAASSFIYIAVADLIPTLHKKNDFRTTMHQMLLVGAGVLMIFWTHSFVH